MKYTFVHCFKETKYLKSEDCLIFSTGNFLQNKENFISLKSKKPTKNRMIIRYFYELINVKLISLRGCLKKKEKKEIH
jgi:hypothetical protein